MTEYQPNSHKSKAEQAEAAAERRVQKVIRGKVKTRDNKGRKLADVFISEDAANVKSYILMDVLVPAFKKLVSDIVTDGVDMILYGSTGGSSKRKSSSKVSYRSYYDDKRSDRRERDGYTSHTRFDYEDIVFESRGDAELVRDQMDDMIDRYGFVTVADMYDMADERAPFTANKYGWTNIRNAEPVRVRDGGYILKLPKAMPID